MNRDWLWQSLMPRRSRRCVPSIATPCIAIVVYNEASIEKQRHQHMYAGSCRLRTADLIIDRTYAVGVLSLRQSGTLYFTCVRFFRAPRGKTAHRTISTYHAAAGEKCGC